MDWYRVPADDIDTSPRSADWSARLFANADIETLTHLILNCGVESSRANDYSIPLYHEKDATTTRKVYLRPGYPGAFRAPRGQVVPWNPKWKPSGGTDGHMVILCADGEWDFWAATAAPSSWEAFKAALNGDNFAAGYRGSTGVILAATCVWAPLGTNGDGVVVGPTSAGVIRPQDIETGELGYAVKIAVGGQCSMVGPEAPAGIDIDDSRIGTTYGIAVAPATTFESRKLTGDLRKMVSDARRFQLTITEDEALSRLWAGGLRGTLLDTGIVIANAMRSHGIFTGHTTKTRAAVMGDGANPAAWNALGVKTEKLANTMLAGLIRGPGDLRCLDVPTSTLADGSTTRRHGKATRIDY